MTLSRREALKAAAGLAIGPPLGAFQEKKRVPIGVQLYSVRDLVKNAFDGTLKAVADLGFEGVEFAGYYQYDSDAAGLRKKLDALGLKAAGTHISAGSLGGEALKRTTEFHATLGCRFLIVPFDRRFTHPERSKELAELMNKAAAALKPAGLFCGYHNHTEEFKKEGDKTYWELFAERTSKDVVLQQDVGWTVAAGLDPVEIVKKYPGRIRTTHLKAKGKNPFIGEEGTDWKGLLAACLDVGGTEWFVVEQEDYPDRRSPLECTKRSFEGLKKLLADMGR